MDKERVAQIIREQGYSPRFRDYVGRRGNGVSRTFVYAIAPGIGRALGNLSTIAQMSDDELRAHIEAKFAQSSAQKARHEMDERKNNVVGILQLHQILTCIQALEKLEKEAQAIVDQTPDSQLDDEWVKWQGIAVSARGALGAFHLIADRARQINANPDTAYTIHWEGGLEKAMEAMGLTFKSEPREEEQHG